MKKQIEWNIGNMERGRVWESSKTDKNAISQMQKAHEVSKKL